jgi:hypothetical protein
VAINLRLKWRPDEIIYPTLVLIQFLVLINRNETFIKWFLNSGQHWLSLKYGFFQPQIPALYHNPRCHHSLETGKWAELLSFVDSRHRIFTDLMFFHRSTACLGAYSITRCLAVWEVCTPFPNPPADELSDAANYHTSSSVRNVCSCWSSLISPQHTSSEQ